MKYRLLAVLLLSVCVAVAQQKSFLVVGTYTGAGSKGIYVYDFSNNNANTTLLSTQSSSNPSFLAVAPNKKWIYAVNEDADFSAGKEGGGVTAYRFNSKTGKLDSINQLQSGGNHPCYVTTSKLGKFVWVANYSSGSFSCFPVNTATGALQPAIVHEYLKGNGPNTERQQAAHVHATVLNAANNRLYVPDLGSDKVWTYQMNPISGKIKPAGIGFASVTAGSGPRHLALHPNKPWAYLTEELTGKVVLFYIKQDRWTAQQELSTYPADYKGSLSNADVHISPNGKFLYASNRGEANSLAIYSINPMNGQLALQGFQSVMGVKPRNFNFDPSGKYLLVANQESNNIVIFSVNPTNGLLTDTGKRIEVPNPVCIQFVSR